MKQKLAVLLLGLLPAMFLAGCSSEEAAVFNFQINWGISLPTPERTAGIFHYDFREGQDFDIWYYTSDKAQQIKEHPAFRALSSENRGEVSEKLTFFYESLNGEEREKFEHVTSLQTCLQGGNHYACVISPEKPGCFLLLILNGSSNELYALNFIS